MAEQPTRTVVKPASEHIDRKPCPEANANIFSKLFFIWLIPFIYKGWKKPLQDEDLWELRPFEKGQYTTNNLLQEYRNLKHTQSKYPKLQIALFRNHRSALFFTAVLKITDVTLQLVQPVFVNRLLVFLQQRNSPVDPPPNSVGIGWSFALLLAPFLKTLVENHYFIRTMRGGMRVRSGVQGVIYDKSLRMSPSARAASSLGEIVNLMQLDSQRIGDFFQFFHVLWSAPIQILAAVGLLYHYIGVSAVIGLIVTLCTFPIQGKLMVMQVRLRKAGIGITDRRVKLINEILQGIKAVKFYAWEEPFAAAVDKERRAEVKKFSHTIWLRSAFFAIMMVMPILVGVITFTFFSAVFGQALDPARIFTGIALLNQLRAPILMLPMTVNAYIDARIGMKRIERFIGLENTNNYSRREKGSDSDSIEDGIESDSEGLYSGSSNGSTGASIAIEGGSFEWSKLARNEETSSQKKGLLSKCIPNLKKRKKTPQGTDASNNENEANGLSTHISVRGPVLSDINLKMKSGQLVAIIGRVGSGKSSLIHAILGEMRKLRGSVTLHGSVAYVAQTAWIFNDTLRNNITFGKDFDEHLYKKAISVSALEHDMNILPAGDMTAIGEKGINLSGGQKQRVSIARAVYANADVYLFDDPLSALDAHVSQEVFQKCFSRRGFLKNKLRVLITNQVHVLPQCDEVVFLENGVVRCQGQYAMLAATDQSFQQLINEQQEEEAKHEKEEGRTRDESVNEASKHSTAISISKQEEETSKMKFPQSAAGTTLMQEEERKTGNVLLRAYYQYAVACGGVLMFLFMLVFWGATVALSVIAQWWLSYWSERELANDTRPLGFFLGIYFALTIGYAIATMMRSVWFLNLALFASKKLHDKMLGSVLRAPITFFDTTPIGRIISRFSRDVQTLDELLPQFFSQMLTTTLNLIAAYAFIGVILPIFFSVAVPVTIFYFILQRFFNRTSLELKRLDAISKSPIYAHFSETLGGLSTIRAYGKQNQAREENMRMIDVNQRAYFSWIAANRWFSLNLEMAGTLLIFATALFSVFAPGDTFAGNIGLGLTYALQVTGILGFTVRSITELEGQMSSVERVRYYSEDLPQEAPAKLDPKEDPKPPGWPAKGDVEIKDVQLRYREELDLVLKGVNVSISGGEKIGVVGRTGSGKSSLMIAILRMVEIAGGRISVDGVNLHDLGLDDVRNNITIIPQDPVVFSGTIRFNLDPFSKHSEAELWDALEKSHLKQFVQEFEGGLDAQVSEYGENMSAGQRQVICLTRALLRNSKILILDEASSSLDMETDRLIQETIRTHLKDATILTIAHRLFTLADYDKILVMEDGFAVEYGSPADLLGRADGKLKALVDSMGPRGAAQFRQLVGIGTSSS
ncbi:Multidrug resistance-associated protein 1 [Gracilariopsis chorda]|uniref:Probable ATP-dependent transporter ycf16 n=1 Tax=Gracilariopsis chorda TaxID=448386 RepID=A0A2V3JC58_9FLOR|nr:Multidrug resistance-associated protein 1 [Gracilariopsis chorda]|eukprot:PXF49940.1 Multidrug resistance-associated protein 1 [Gracilariopsis chorda]